MILHPQHHQSTYGPGLTDSALEGLNESSCELYPTDEYSTKTYGMVCAPIRNIMHYSSSGCIPLHHGTHQVHADYDRLKKSILNRDCYSVRVNTDPLTVQRGLSINVHHTVQVFLFRRQRCNSCSHRNACKVFKQWQRRVQSPLGWGCGQRSTV